MTTTDAIQSPDTNLRRIFISTPIHHYAEPQFEQTLREAIQTSQEVRARQVVISQSVGDSLIMRQRNAHFSEFLARKDCEWFFSIDSDIVIENRTSDNNMFDILIRSGKDFIGGLYSLKADPPRCASVVMFQQDLAKPNAIIPARWLSTGCWAMHRRVAERLSEAYPHLWYDGDGGQTGRKQFGIYLIDITPIWTGNQLVRKMLSEDWQVCQRWLQIGGEVWAHTGIRLGHVGKKTYYMDEPKQESKDATAVERGNAHNGPSVVDETSDLLEKTVRAYRTYRSLGLL